MEGSGEGLGRASFDLDYLLALVNHLLALALKWIGPVLDFIKEVAGGSWFGAVVVFSIFFAVFLIRAGARSGVSNMRAFAGALEHYASWGLLLSGGVLALMCLEWLVMPVWTVIYTALANSLTGGEPGVLQLVAFLAERTDARGRFFGEMRVFYSKGHTVMPLGFRGMVFIVAAFGTMWLVARGMGRLR